MNSRLVICASLVLASVTALVCAGCVLPPRDVEPSVLEARELDLVSAINRGKEYAESGRMDLAELHFRRALQLAPSLAALHNDLGYVLQAQNRGEEALRHFERSLVLYPQGLTARDNFARLLYREGDYERAEKEYQRLLNFYFGYWAGGVEGRPNMNFTIQDLVSVYRNLAAIYVNLGNVGEGICYSRLALAAGDSSYQVLHHARLLLSLEQTRAAFEALRAAISVRTTAIPPEMLFDYGIASYLEGSTLLATQAFERLASEPRVDVTLKENGRLARLVVAMHQQDRAQAAGLIAQLDEDGEKWCRETRLVEEQYWPKRFSDEMTETFRRVCAKYGTVS